MRMQANATDPAIVHGLHGARYACPDITTVDYHLADLAGSLRRTAPRFTLTAQCFRTDIDRLLDRRNYLMLTRGTEDQEVT